MTYVPPEELTLKTMKKFIEEVGYIFSPRSRNIRGFTLEMAKFRQMDLIGQLLIYKFISYTATFGVFRNPSIHWIEKCYAFRTLSESGLYDVVQVYSKESIIKQKLRQAYEAIKVKTTKDFIFAPRAILRAQIDERTKLENDFNMAVAAFYGEGKLLSIVCTAMNEILMNYWSHAIEDSNTVMIARGDRDHIEMVFIDNGQGICTTLRQADPQYSRMMDYQVLEEALKKGVTSKKDTSHMGYGLYYVKEICTANSGCLEIVSGTAYAAVDGKKQKFGGHPYWKGSITYLRLALTSIKGISDIKSLTEGPSVEINWR